MRPNAWALLVPLVLMLVACSSKPASAGWQGTDVHLVDGTWIGTETKCGPGEDGIECRTITERTLAALAPDIRRAVTRTVLASLPTTYVTAEGEVRTARLSAGINARRAIVIDQVGGARLVIGAWCHLPYSGTGLGLDVEAATCAIAPLDYWLDGNAPPSYPPGTGFG